MERQSVPYAVTLVIVIVFIVVFLLAALLIINPGLLRALTSPAGAVATVPAPQSPAAVTPAFSPSAPPDATLTVSEAATAIFTATSVPPTIVLDTATAQPLPTTALPAPSATPTKLPTHTPAPTATGVPLNKDRAEFVADVTVPDGTVFATGESFTKTWRIKNVGTTTWTTQYLLEFTVGSQMAVNKQMLLPAEVGPGDTVDLSMDMVAPATPGDHTALFQFRNAQGVPFGVGPQYNEAIYVKIKVVVPSPTP